MGVVRMTQQFHFLVGWGSWEIWSPEHHGKWLFIYSGRIPSLLSPRVPTGGWYQAGWELLEVKEWGLQTNSVGLGACSANVVQLGLRPDRLAQVGVVQSGSFRFYKVQVLTDISGSDRYLRFCQFPSGSDTFCQVPSGSDSSIRFQEVLTSSVRFC